MSRKVLGQKAGNGAVQTLYSVPPNTQTTVSTLVLQTVSTTALASCSVRIAINGATDDVSTQQVHAVDLDPGERSSVTEGWTLAAGDLVRVLAPVGIAINLFGLETPA